MQKKMVKIPLYGPNELLSLDPSRITNATQSNLIRSLYSTLVYFDQNGRIRPGAAEKINLVGSRVEFHIRKNLLLNNKDLLTSEDVYYSFKRQLVLNNNTHGKLRDFIDCTPLPSTIHDVCSGISFTENIFTISLKSEKYFKFFLPMLANPDFAILQKKSFNLLDKNLEITERYTTTGAYYISEMDEGRATLKANEFHYLIDHRSPTEIEIAFNIGENRDARFFAGDFDVIPTFGVFTIKSLRQISDISDFNIHKTMPIQLTFVDFNKVGVHPLSKAERIFAGKALREAYLGKFQREYELQETDQYFVVVGEGELTLDQREKIQIILSVSGNTNRKIKADLANVLPTKAEKIISQLSGFEYKELKSPSDAQTLKSPDAYVMGTDAGGFDNISLLSYLQSLRHFGLTDEQFSNWLNDYIETEDENLRLEKFRELHFKMLSDVEVLPIAAEPYYGIARKPWKIEAYQMFAGSPFWTIKHE